MRKYALLAILALVPLGLSAARLTLRNGTVVYGQFVSGNNRNIVFEDKNGARRNFDLDEIQTLDFTPVSAAVSNDQYQRPDNQRPDYQRPDYQRPSDDTRNRSGEYRSEQRYQNDWTVLPAGTEIAVRTDENINSGNAAQGRTFPASMARDIMDANGNIVIPRGSAATLIVRQVNEGGTLSNGNFVLDLDSVQVNGRRYAVNTVDLEARDRNGIGKNKRTGEMVGGGAVLGTLLGAIAGGGKGAAIGAVAGAAAGGGAQVLTKGHEIRVPAETVLTFRLEEPLHLREM
jgi:hypothetical protein